MTRREVKVRFALWVAVSAALHVPLFLLPYADGSAALAAAAVLTGDMARQAPSARAAKPPPPRENLLNPEPAAAAAEPEPAPAPAGLPEYELGALAGPRLKGGFAPAYPVAAKRLGKEGRVRLRLTIDADGAMLGSEVLESSAPEFLAAVERELRRARFEPARSGGAPVKCLAVLPVTFRLER